MAAIDNLYRPKLARAIQCSIEKIVIRLGPSLEKFEEELSLSVQNEYKQQQQQQQPMALAGGTAQVIKRYLRVPYCWCCFSSLFSHMYCDVCQSTLCISLSSPSSSA